MKEKVQISTILLLAVSAIVCFVLLETSVHQPIQIYQVGSPGSGESADLPASSFAEGQSDVVESSAVKPEVQFNLNTASVEELESLPGIGPTLAGRIVEFREENNGFVELEELKEVKGIGDKLFSQIAPYLVLEK